MVSNSVFSLSKRCLEFFWWFLLAWSFPDNDAVHCYSKKGPLFLPCFPSLCKVGTVQEVQTAHSDNPKMTVVLSFLK